MSGIVRVCNPTSDNTDAFSGRFNATAKTAGADMLQLPVIWPCNCRLLTFASFSVAWVRATGGCSLQPEDVGLIRASFRQLFHGSGETSVAVCSLGRGML